MDILLTSLYHIIFNVLLFYTGRRYRSTCLVVFDRVLKYTTHFSVARWHMELPALVFRFSLDMGSFKWGLKRHLVGRHADSTISPEYYLYGLLRILIPHLFNIRWSLTCHLSAPHLLTNATSTGLLLNENVGAENMVNVSRS